MSATNENTSYNGLSRQFPGLKKYLTPDVNIRYNDSTKKMKTYIYDNVRVGGELTRYKIWEVAFYISFYCTSTNQAVRYFEDNFEYQRWVKKNKIGLSHIKDNVVSNISQIPWWSYDLDTLAFYNHEHDTRCLKLGKRSFFEIELRLLPPDTLAIANDTNMVKTIHQEASEWISNLNCFKSNEYIQFTATSKKDKNTE